jgi:MFS family permease
MLKYKPLLVFLLAASFLAYEMAMQVAPAIITQQLMHDLHLNFVGLGLMAGCYYYSYTCMQLPAGLLLDRFCLAKLMFFAIFTCALGALLFGMANGAAQASLARLLMGAGSAFAFIAVLVVIADIFPAKYFALLAGFTQLLAALGAAVGGWPLVPYFAWLGWRQGMVYLGLVGIVLALIVSRWGRYPKLSARHATPIHLRAKLSQVLGNRQTWYLALYACLMWAPMAAFASLWGIPFLQTVYRLTDGQAAALNSLLWLGIALGSPLLGWWSDKLGQRKFPLAFVAFLGMNSMACLVFFSHLSFWLLAILLLLTGAACSGQALSFALVKDNNVAANNATAIAFNNMAVVISGAIFQPLIGKLIQLHAPSTSHQTIAYLSADFQFGLSLLPLCFAIAFIIGLFCIREQVN